MLTQPRAGALGALLLTCCLFLTPSCANASALPVSAVHDARDALDAAIVPIEEQAPDLQRARDAVELACAPASAAPIATTAPSAVASPPSVALSPASPPLPILPPEPPSAALAPAPTPTVAPSPPSAPLFPAGLCVDLKHYFGRVTTARDLALDKLDRVDRAVALLEAMVAAASGASE